MRGIDRFDLLSKLLETNLVEVAHYFSLFVKYKSKETLEDVEMKVMLYYPLSLPF